MMRIWVDDWQVQCCGDAFSVGATVSWTVQEPDREWLTGLLGDQVAATVDAAEEHHGDGPLERVEAEVTEISAVHCRYALKPGADALYPVEGSSVLTPLTEADGWTPNRGELSFVGYLVTLAKS